MMSNKDQQNKQQQQQPGGGGLQQQHGQQQASYQPQGMQQQGMQPQTHQQGQAMGGTGPAQFQMHPQGGSMMHGSGAGTQGSMGGQMGGMGGMGGTSGGRQGMEGHGMGSGMGGGMGGTSGGMQGMEGGQQRMGMGMGGMEGGQQRMGMGGMEGGQQRMGMGGMEGGQQRMGMGGMEGGQQRMGMGGMEGGQRMGMGGMEGGQQHHRMEAGGQQRTERRGSASDKGMCIGVIGMGEEGSTLIRKLSKHGYKVCMAKDQKGEQLSQFSKETGACPCDMEDVVKNCDMVFLSIPEKAIMELPKGLFQNAPKELVVVDCCNYYPHRDGQIKELATGTMPESVWVQNQIGKTVVKAFNAVLAGALHEAGCPKGSHERIAVPYAGDDARAKSMVAKVIEDLGFDAYDCGELNQSWKFQPGSPAYCTHLSLKEMDSAIRGAKREDMPKLRDEAYQKMTSAQRHMDWRAMSQMLRETYQTHKHIGGGMEKEKQQMGGTQGMQQPTSA